MQLIFQFQFIFTQVQSEIRICMHSLNTLMALMPERPWFILIKVIIIMSSIICIIFTIYIIMCTMHRMTLMALPLMPQPPSLSCFIKVMTWWPWFHTESILRPPEWRCLFRGLDSIGRVCEYVKSLLFASLSIAFDRTPVKCSNLYWWFDSVVLPLNLCQPVGQLDVLPEVNFVTLQLFSLVWYEVMVMVMVD